MKTSQYGASWLFNRFWWIFRGGRPPFLLCPPSASLASVVRPPPHALPPILAPFAPLCGQSSGLSLPCIPCFPWALVRGSRLAPISADERFKIRFPICSKPTTKVRADPVDLPRPRGSCREATATGFARGEKALFSDIFSYFQISVQF